MVCKISNANYDGVWYKDGKQVCMFTESSYRSWVKDAVTCWKQILVVQTVTIVSAQIKSTDDLMIVKDGALHKLVIKKCTEDDNGKYRFEADGRKTEALLIVKGKLIYWLMDGLVDWSNKGNAMHVLDYNS